LPTANEVSRDPFRTLGLCYWMAWAMITLQFRGGEPVVTGLGSRGRHRDQAVVPQKFSMRWSWSVVLGDFGVEP